MWLHTLLVLSVALVSTEAACKTSDAKWKGPPSVKAVSSSRPERVLVDWQASISHPECADSFEVWVWKEGQEKSQGKKSILTGHQALKMEVSLEPCVFYNIAVDLKEKDWINSHHRESAVTKYNSANLPASLKPEDMLPYFSVGYHKDPTSGRFDLTKASVRVQTSFITFASCVKHLEVTGRQKSGVRATQAGLSGPRSSTSGTPDDWERTDGGWEPYGTGRLPGGKGRPAERRWGSLGGWNTKPWGHPSSSVPKTQRRLVASGTGADWSYPTSQPSLPAQRAASVSTTAAPPAIKDTRSIFTNIYPRMPESSSATAGPATTAPPFRGQQVEVVVPVEPCKEYEFSLRIVTPAGGSLLTMPGLLLPPLPDIEDYVPPPFTEVVKMSVTGGKLTLTTQTSSPVPASCLPRYMEAVDAYANRVEAAANSAEGETRIAEVEMGRAQDLVEVTQKKILARQGCVCDSPRIEVGGKVFLYQGQSDGRPYYRSDIEGRSLPSPTLPTSSPRRNKRSAFIGRVDGGGTTTTRRPWNYGAHGGGSGAWSSSSSSSSSSSRSWSSSTSTGIGGSRLGVSSSRGTLGGSRVSASSIGSRLGPGLPPPPPSPQFLYWSSTSKAWLISPNLGAPESQAELSSQPSSTSLCPADIAQVWRTKQARTRSGSTTTWVDTPGTAPICAPDFIP